MSVQLVRQILHQIEIRCAASGKLPYLSDLEYTVQNLEDEERALLCWKVANNKECNGKMLELLSRLGLVSVAQYLTQIENDEERVFSICDDFMENHSGLFADLVIHAMDVEFPRYVDLVDILQDYLRLFTLDVSQLPEESNKNLLSNIFTYLNIEGQTFVGLTIIKAFIQLHPLPIIEAISNQSSWNESTHANLIQILNDCLTHEVVLDQIFSFVRAQEENVDWKNYLQVLQIACEKFGAKNLKTFLNACFVDGVKNKNDRSLHLMFLTARKCIHLVSFGNYHNWYKATIGEMTYKIQKDEFRYVIKVLTRMTEFETDPKILRTHQRIVIQSPPHCKELVSLYKAVVKSKLESMNDVQMMEDVIEIV